MTAVEPAARMALSRSLVETKAAEYADEEPLYAVEAEQIESLPGAFASGEYGWRDAEWVVQWYYRRSLGAYPDDRRRAREAAYAENDFEAVREAIATARAADEPAAALEALLDLEGVDVGVASAFLLFSDPSSYGVVGPREWRALRGADELDEPVPDPLTVRDYTRYLGVCRRLAERCDCDQWTLYRALWRLGDEVDG